MRGNFNVLAHILNVSNVKFFKMNITLTQFVDFVSKSGSPKLSAVRAIYRSHEEGYSPEQDFYKRFREGVIELHQTGTHVRELHRVIGDLPPHKAEHYDNMVAGYKKFIGRKTVTWFDTPRRNWDFHELTVNIKPEIGLTINDTPTLIKLYTKSDKLTKDRIKGILCLMHRQLHPIRPDCGVALLDVRNSKFYEYTDDMDELMPLMEGEALSFINIYNSLVARDAA